MNDTEQGRCDFCGEKTTVAVSEQHSARATICAGCASWALDELRTAASEGELTPVVAFYVNPHGGWELRGSFGTKWARSEDEAVAKLRAILTENAR